MPPGDGLRCLQMCKSRHDVFGTGVGLINQSADEPCKVPDSPVDFLPDPHPEIGCDLVVPASGSVEPPGGAADDVLEPGLDIHVNVLKRLGEVELSVLDL